jgi:GNAT superfamily N-acetyltransferase
LISIAVGNLMTTGSELDQVVYGYWAKRFGCAPEDFRHSGTRIVKDEELAGTVYIYHVDRMRLVRIAPSLAKQVGLPEGQLRDSGSPTMDGVQSLVRAQFRVEVGRTLLDCYMDGEDFQFLAVPGDFTARRLHLEDDNAHLLGLYDKCTEEDLDAAMIYVDDPDPVIFGLFHKGQLAAYASHRYWGEIIADIGVLVHPDYRSRGLGKAVVSVLCEWCIQNGVVPMYRVFSDHTHSRRIGEALGFKEMVVIESSELSEERVTAAAGER